MVGPLVNLILILIIVFFYIGAFVAIFSNSEFLRKAYVVTLFSVMLFVIIVGLGTIPFFNWGMFSDVPPIEEQHFELRVEDSASNELLYAPHATFPAGTASIHSHAQNLACGEYSEPEASELIVFLISSGNNHISEINSNRGVIDRLSYPSHDYGNRWDRSTLDGFGKIERIHVDLVSVTMSESGTEVEAMDRNRILTADASGKIERLEHVGPACS